MKFRELLVKVSSEVTEYRRDIFNTIIIALDDTTYGKSGKRYQEQVHILTRLRINSVLYDFPDNSGERNKKRIYR